MDNPYRISGAKLKRRVRLVAVPSNPIDVVNRVTGVVEYATPYVGRREWRDISDFVKVYESEVLYELSAYALKVMFYIWEEMDFEGGFIFKAEDCAGRIGVGKRMVFRGMKELKDRDFVKKDKGCHYWFNPNIAFRGNRDDLIN